MTSDVDGSVTANTYELRCTDCTFETTVVGSFADAFEVADSHQEGHGERSLEHFVNVRLDGYE